MFLAEYWWVYAACAVIALYFCVWALTAARKVMLPGAVPYRYVGAGIVAVLLSAVIFARSGLTAASALLVGCILLAFLLSASARSGLGENGAYIGGRVISYGRIYYYAFESDLGEGYFRMRVNTGYRDVSLRYPEEKRETVRALLISKGVLSFAEYKEKKFGKKPGK